MDLTIILPIRNERENLAPVIDEIEQVMTRAQKSFEIIAVDDASDDGSSQALREMATQRSYVKVIHFRRNFGQAAAFDAGFRHASGDVVVTMDADGQNDPADIPRMLELLDSGYDFVAGRRARRNDGFFLRKVPSKIANAIIRLVTRTRIRDLGCSLKLYRKPITDELRLYGEMHRFIPVLVEAQGARIAEIDVNHRPRTRGVSKYNLTRTFKVLLDLQTVWFMRGYQSKPIYVFGGIGMFLVYIAILLTGFVAWEKITTMGTAGEIYVHRNPLFLLAMVLTVIGVQFVCLGLLAEVMVRTYFESQNKSSYTIVSKEGFGDGKKEPQA